MFNFKRSGYTIITKINDQKIDKMSGMHATKIRDEIPLDNLQNTLPDNPNHLKRNSGQGEISLN